MFFWNIFVKFRVIGLIMCIVFHIVFWTHFLQIRRVCHHFYFKPYRLHHISSPSPFLFSYGHTFHQPHRFDMFSFFVKFIGVVTFYHFMSFHFSFYAICINVLIFGFFFDIIIFITFMILYVSCFCGPKFSISSFCHLYHLHVLSPSCTCINIILMLKHANTLTEITSSTVMLLSQWFDFPNSGVFE